MCSLTWSITSRGYEVFFNRDEKRSRRAAKPPAVFRTQETDYLAPVDAEFGGTWIAVNNFGITLALLNYYPQSFQESGAEYRSRGMLIAPLIAHRHPEGIDGALQAMRLGEFRPFTLAIFSRTSAPRVFEWDGSGIASRGLDPDSGILTSSSYLGDQVQHCRIEEFKRLRRAGSPLASDALMNFHRGHESMRGAFSVCMHRPDAKTVSLSWISVDRSQSILRYYNGSPCSVDFQPGGFTESVSISSPSFQRLTQTGGA